MKVKELVEQLLTEDQDAEVVLQKDSEGNLITWPVLVSLA